MINYSDICDICQKTDQFKIIINRELTGSDIFVSSVCWENRWNLHVYFYQSSMSIYQVFFFLRVGVLYMESFFDFTFKRSWVIYAVFRADYVLRNEFS